MSTKKTRKPLGDALANQFVYGGEQQPPEQRGTFRRNNPPEKEVSPTVEKQKESDLMAKLQTPPKEATVRFTVDMPESLHKKLSLLAARTGKKKAEIVRVLLEDALQNVDS